MARNVFGTVTERGVKSTFLEAMSKAPNVYLNHTENVSSEAPDEKYVWLGAVPIPRELIGSRVFAQFNEFSHTVTNKGYELSFIIDRDSFDDDQVGSIQGRIAEVAEAYAHFKDAQFATLLEDADTSTDTFDGTTFYDDTRTIGDSGTIDNDRTSDIVDKENPTTAELLAALEESIVAMSRFNDDKGRPFNGTAMDTLRCVIPPEYRRAFTEVINSTIIISGGGAAGVSNPWGNGLVTFDTLVNLSAADDGFYMNAMSGTRKPFYFQQRKKLEVVVMNGTNDVALNHGVKVLLWERYRFAYGDPRRSITHVFTTT